MQKYERTLNLVLSKLEDAMKRFENMPNVDKIDGDEEVEEYISVIKLLGDESEYKLQNDYYNKLREEARKELEEDKYVFEEVK